MAKTPHSKAPQGDTKSAAEPDPPWPRLPHEHDESSDSQRSSVPPGQGDLQAHHDMEHGTDTDRGPVLDRVYNEKVIPGAPPSRHPPRAR